MSILWQNFSNRDILSYNMDQMGITNVQRTCSYVVTHKQVLKLSPFTNMFKDDLCKLNSLFNSFKFNSVDLFNWCFTILFQCVSQIFSVYHTPDNN